ncbi:TPA: DUF4065 domain-containing protein [Legionella pneumophila]|nr:SocA family protein [Legionella pneumophila]HAT6978606.1 DUF4065 domain-containing protein [Legionella pneumophila]HAU1322188.1 DUF4065 domain-containing protein [Legionella pneumophila]HBI2947819.1 SocA family protein [Legionella pneumophila]
MTKLKDVIAYTLKNYPIKEELSNARVTKIIFLADWHQAINHGRQISNIKWVFDNYGPFVWDIYNEALSNPDLFDIQETENIYGQKKKVLLIKDTSYNPEISDIEKQSIDHVLNITKKLYWDDFIKLVYSTYPVMSSERYSTLDLISKAKEYSHQE